MPEGSNPKLAKKFKLIIILAILIIFVAALFLVFKPKYEQIMASRAEFKNQEEHLQNLKKNLVDVKKMIENYEKIDSKDIEKITLALPSEDDIPGLFVQLEVMAEESGLNLLAIDITEEKEAVEIGKIFVKEMDIALNLSGGDYTFFKKFLETVESNLRIMDIESLSFAPEAATYTVNLKTYYRE